MAAGSNVVMNVENMSKRYGRSWALRNASFSIRPGEILGLIGPNGSGKSTLFRCLAGVTPPTSGIVRLAVNDREPETRKDILYFMPDGVRPLPDQTVEWVLHFVAGVHRRPSSAVDETVVSLGLAPLLPTRLGVLSTGQHRRVLLAMGLLTPQPLLMLDEPFDGLDLRQTRDVMMVLRQQAAHGRTLFLSIHQLVDAARICDRLVLLSRGRVVGEGTLDELRAKTDVRDGGLEEVFLALT